MTYHDTDEADSQRTVYFLDRGSGQLENTVSDGNSQICLDETKLCDDLTIPFPRLFGGEEPEAATRLRWEIFQRSWEVQQKQISRLLGDWHDTLLANVNQFIGSSWQANEHDEDDESPLDTCILLPGPNMAEHMRLFQQVRAKIASSNENGENITFVASIASKECPNLKTALKLIVMRLTEQQDGSSAPTTDETKIETEEDIDMEVEGEDDSELRYDKRLRYDFDILVEWCKRQAKLRNITMDQIRIVICVEDSDSFLVSVLAELIKYLQSYVSQLPLKLMFSVATSLAVFQDKLPKQCIRLVRGTALNAQIESGPSQVLLATMFTDASCKDTFTQLTGPHLLMLLQRRQTNSLQSIDSYISSLQYIRMSHFYGNPLTILSECENEEQYLGCCDPLLTDKHLTAIRMLPSFMQLVDKLIEERTSECKDRVRRLLLDDQYLRSQIWPALSETRKNICSVLDATKNIYNLQHRLLPREKQSSVTSIFCLLMLDREEKDKSEAFLELRRLVEESDKNLLESIHSSPLSMLLIECFLPNNKSLMANVFTPTYRAAIELGLCDPTHYWGGEIHKDSDAPYLSIMYQLYRESSVYINSYDYYTAFRNCLEQPTGLSDVEWAQKSLAWFLQGISELKFIGILRDCKRKFECVEKIAWKGL